MKQKNFKRDGLMKITLSDEQFNIVLDNCYVISAEPLGKWMIGKHIKVIRQWVEKKGGKLE